MKKSNQGLYKFNSDETSKGNIGSSSIAFCIINDEGDLVYESRRQPQENTSTYAETLAMKKGCNYCVEHHKVPLEFEADSFSLVKMVKWEWQIPWTIRGIIRKIQNMMELELIKLQHTYREENTLTDFLANWCFNFAIINISTIS